MAKVILKSYIKSLHGRIGNIIHYNVNGCQYARSYTLPSNPRTVKQQLNRASFASAVKKWQQLSPAEKNRYNRMADGGCLSGYNIFISLSMKGLTIKIINRIQNGQATGSCISVNTLLRGTSVYSSNRCADVSLFPARFTFYEYKPPGQSVSAA